MDDQEIMALSNNDGVSIHAGFPNPAADRRQSGLRLSLDLNQYLIKHPSSSYIFRISGHHWSDQGIFDGDVAIIDRILPPAPSDLVIVWEANGFGIYRRQQLAADEEPWGVVSSVIHQFRRVEQYKRGA